EVLLRLRVAEEAAAAEKKLRGVALDGATLPLALTFVELQREVEAMRRAFAVHDVGDDLRRVVADAAHRVMGEPGDGAVVGVEILRGGADDERRLEVAD